MRKVFTGLLTALVSGCYCHGAEPLPRGVPTPEQMAWHDMEIQMFVALDPCTWQGREYDNHSTPLDTINPTKLDTDQWCEVAKSFGAKQILFVAKHTGGFCWWQTETTDYSIKKTPYRDGKGDVLAELSKSCKKHGLKLALYIYPGDDQWGANIGSGGRTKDPAKQDVYAKVLRQQWTEVLTRYGEISELWFDGSCVIDLSDIIQKYAPKAMVFQGPHATLRWPGNEAGTAPYPTWQTVKKADAITGVSTGLHSDPEGDVWLPMEMDTTLLDHKWFWAPNTDRMLKSTKKLLDIYYTSVGRGCVLLLNATPDTTGLIPASHVRRYDEFGKAISRIYEHKKGEVNGTGRTLELRFDRPTPVNHIILGEDLKLGQIVRAYEVYGLINHEWKKLLDGTSIGYKKIDVIDTATVEGLRLRVTRDVGEPVIRSFTAYDVVTTGERPNMGSTKTNAWREISAWKTVALTEVWQTIDLDLSPYIPLPGQYEVELRTSGGQGKPEVQNMTVVVAGTEAPRLITPAKQPCAWILSRTDQVTEDAQGRTTLRLQVRTKKAEARDVSSLYIRSLQ